MRGLLAGFGLGYACDEFWCSVVVLGVLVLVAVGWGFSGLLYLVLVTRYRLDVALGFVMGFGLWVLAFGLDCVWFEFVVLCFACLSGDLI